MRYRQLTINNTAVGTISPQQYDKLKKAGHRVHGNGSVKTVYTDYDTWQAERAEARRFIHQKYHKKYPDKFCYYDGCKKSVNNN